MKLLFQITQDDVNYYKLLYRVINPSATGIVINNKTPSTITEVVLRAKEKGCDAVVTCDPALLKLIVGDTRKQPSIDDYMGSLVVRHGMEFLIVPPIQHIVTVPYGEFLYKRYFSKYTQPEKWFQYPEFDWELFNPAKTDELIDFFATTSFMSCDIETGKESDRVITCVGFTGVKISRNPNMMTVRTVVVPFDDMYNVVFIRCLLSLPTAKVFQNGKYDNAYLLRFASPAYNWCGDTLNLFHCWYSELPKDLAFIATFCLREWQFWKDESQTSDIMEYYRYNAKDCFATAMAWISMLVECPDYVWNNYRQEFPLVFPCLQSELTGLKRNQQVMDRELERFEASMETRLAKLQAMVGNKNFNPSSPPQTLKLFEILGSGDIKSTDDKARDKVMDRHPINRRILSEIKGYREDRKLVTSYLKDGYGPNHRLDKLGMTKTWNGRMFYGLHPSKTDTGRLASSESAFWCGWQIQNIPRDREDVQVKEGIESDDGFYFGEADYSQNEARGTAYLSGDTNLIAVVDDETRDFHGQNASRFFGIPYNQIIESYYDETLYIPEWTHKVLNKPVRQTSKNTNHGANYNMGANVLLITMGIAAVRRAQSLLNLPNNWPPERVCQYLLDSFDKAYPTLRSTKEGGWYARIISDIKSNHKLVGPTGWTRYCFGDPTKSKHWLNAYAAHHPQSLAAMQLNRAYNNVFYRVALAWPNDFKLGPQIHDSILFQYRKGRKDLAFAVKNAMRVPIPVTDIRGITRTLIVPVDLKGEATAWSRVKSLRWDAEAEALSIMYMTNWNSREMNCAT